MRIAWFTPATGSDPLVEYSRRVVSALAQRSELILCCDRRPEHFPDDVPVVEVDPDLSSRVSLDYASVDAVVYLLGDAVERYAWIYERSRAHSGIIVLGAPTLHRFFLSYYLDQLRCPELYVTRMAEYYGRPGLASAHRVLERWFDSGEAHLSHEDELRYTLIEEALREANGAVAHTPAHASLIRQLWSGPVCEICIPAYGLDGGSVLRYVEEFLPFARRHGHGSGVDRLAKAQARAIADDVATYVGVTLGTLGTQPGSREAEAVIAEVGRLLSP